jgi:hypothetical protein
MAERESPAEVVLLEWLCDECGEPMSYDGYCQPMSPPKYGHSCENGHAAMLLKTYPTSEVRKKSVFAQIAGL